MLLFKGIEAFEIWTGADAPVVEAMNAALRASWSEVSASDAVARQNGRRTRTASGPP